jgi:hypothetical protein
MDRVKDFANKVKKEWDGRTPVERAGLVASVVVATAGLVLVGRKVSGKKEEAVSEKQTVTSTTTTTTGADGNILQKVVDTVTSAVSGKK